jgi:hypothetical protein
MLFYPRLNEKFAEDSDPIRDMKIGVAKQIEEYIEEHDEDNSVKSGYLTPAVFILGENNINEETKKVWIEYILSQDNEDLSEWNEDDIINMRDIGIKFFPNLKHLPYADIQLKGYKDGKYTISATDWEDFSEFFKDNREIDEKSIKTILSGESWELFEPYVDFDSFRDILDNFDKDEAKKVFNVLKPLCNQRTSKTKSVKEITELFYLIEHEGDLDDLKNAISNSAATTVAFGQEGEAFKELTQAIERKYQLTRIDSDSPTLHFSITQKGLDFLFLANWLEEHKIDYYPPQYGWQGDFNVDEFLEYIQDNM